MSKQRTFLGGLVLVAVTALVTGRVVSQEATRRPSDQLDPATPSKHHEVLNRIAGRWDHEVRIRRAPDQEPETCVMTADYRWILGGRFLTGAYKGYIGGEYFEARDLLGYDNVRGQYNSLWVDNQTTAFTMATGRYDEKQDALILEGTQDDVEKQVRDEPFRFVYRFGGDGAMTIEVYVPGPDGTMFKRVDVRATRIR